MEDLVDRIYAELLVVDPGMGEREVEVKDAIRELAGGKPDAKPDPEFERALKAKLLARFDEERNERIAAGRRRARMARLSIGVASAACVVAALGFFVFGGPSAPAGIYSMGGETALSYASNGDVEASAVAGKSVEAAGEGANAGGAVAATAEPSSANRPVAAATPAEVMAFKPSADAAASTTALTAPTASATSVAAAPSMAFERSAEVGGSTGGSTGVASKERADAFASDADDAKAETGFDTEGYSHIVENPFLKSIESPLSTFSIDVDTASYSNARRYLLSGSLPPPDAVRIEEFVNYFDYAYVPPTDGRPVAFATELATCPWNPGHLLLRVAIKAREVATSQLPPSNLVFLIDVSGSMADENKLPLVKQALGLLVDRLRAIDRVSIVTYAGSAGVVLQPTSGSDKGRIRAAIDSLGAGGSTAGGAGITLAYDAAKRAFIKGGNNRVILATDGDFNEGASSDADMTRLIEEKRKEGVFLTVLGFGMGNYKDSKMQSLADAGNGNHAYIDTKAEAERVLVGQMAGTLFTVAKDVKVQVEFNPSKVESYRLIGYENRMLAARDFDDDAKDAGEMGAGSEVTAFYELVPAKGAAASSTLTYSTTTVTGSSELMTIKFRYKHPERDTSELLEAAIPYTVTEFAAASADFRFAAAVVEWTLVLRGSEHKGGASGEHALATAKAALGDDKDGSRAEFVYLVQRYLAIR